MYTGCDEENMNFGSSADKKDIGSGYFLLLQPIIALPQWASAHNEWRRVERFFSCAVAWKGARLERSVEHYAEERFAMVLRSTLGCETM